MGAGLVLYFQGITTLRTEIEAWPVPIRTLIVRCAACPSSPATQLPALPFHHPQTPDFATPSRPPLSWKGSQAPPLLVQFIMILISAGKCGSSKLTSSLLIGYRNAISNSKLSAQTRPVARQLSSKDIGSEHY
ncbi:hypothetical protein QCA50_003167 [Cerrena zonata]|uniref:Uncharacterized protein n=1 Tax=Cerrena zonata TaxID=2478898 RepID=A0AAW0GIW7_9APHY